MRTLLLSLLLLLGALPAHAGNAPSWLEDQLYGGGKMNAVVAVVSLILLGIGVWLWLQDRRLTRMEEKMKE